MRRFYIILTIYILVTAVVLVVPATTGLKILLLVLTLLALLAAITYGAFAIGSQVFVNVFCKGVPDHNQVAISFDDGPHPTRTPEILQILDRFGCKASFFLIGRRIEGNEEAVRAIHAAGHTIGNHSFSHSNRFPLYPGSRISREIRDTNQLIERVTGEKVLYFRPPFGVTNPRIHRGLKNSGLRVIGWSIRSFDTCSGSAERLVRRITGRLGGGDIILLHESADQILPVLEQLLPRIREMGLTCVSLDQMRGAR